MVLPLRKTIIYWHLPFLSCLLAQHTIMLFAIVHCTLYFHEYVTLDKLSLRNAIIYFDTFHF